MTTRIDFNCDLGEGCGDDAAIVPCISSASIATGGHAGDEASMRAAIALCLGHGVAIGAHPSFIDHMHFGRRELALPPAEIHALVRAQVEALATLCAQAGTRLAHVKPHGALYNRVVHDRGQAAAVAEAVLSFDPSLPVLTLPGSVLAEVDDELQVVSECYADRAYTPEGTLVPRRSPVAVVTDPQEVAERAVRMAVAGEVEAIDGTVVPVSARSICVHGDTPGAVELARSVRGALSDAGVQIIPFV